MVVVPVISFAAGDFALVFPKASEWFWDIYYFEVKYSPLPIIMLVVIVGWCEIYTSIFHSRRIRLAIKIIIALFLMIMMIAIPLPISVAIWEM